MTGHGGARIGSGQKPRPRKFALVDGALSPLAVAPDDLPEDQKAFWTRWAKPAIEAGTLNERTEAGWRELCELEAYKRQMKATIDQVGLTYIKVILDSSGQEHSELRAHPLVAKHLAIINKVDAMMGRFMLTAFGKPAMGGKPKAQAVNAWAGVAGA